MHVNEFQLKRLKIFSYPSAEATLSCLVTYLDFAVQVDVSNNKTQQ